MQLNCGKESVAPSDIGLDVHFVLLGELLVCLMKVQITDEYSRTKSSLEWAYKRIMVCKIATSSFSARFSLWQYLVISLNSVDKRSHFNGKSCSLYTLLLFHHSYLVWLHFLHILQGCQYRF